MKNWKYFLLYGSWIWLYLLCAGLAHITQPQPAQSVALTVVALIFFIPAVILLIDGLRNKRQKQLRLLRWISISSLVLTLLLLIANVLSALASEAMGNVLHEILIFVSVPMVCSQHWVLSMFLWACLFFATLPAQKKK